MIGEREKKKFAILRKSWVKQIGISRKYWDKQIGISENNTSSVF